ncbi:YdbC family protein [Actinoplanes aureus]|uniref:YdbC family protein n=1 Tax=Actinoplanes aureus TaxID=2792083 RepID=A0A931CJL4_9ACTN|nr:YdbC family protein [Actinoplanes aureus]MBG0567611.1 YdbC family protein [Actinoplanes aureus]
MLIKWVTCTTSDPAAFATGQSAWAGLRDLPGFLGQAGGWSRHEPGRAHIVAWWQDRASYQAFMAGPHDRLAAAQAGAYDTIQVRLFDAPQEIARPVQAALLLAAITGDQVTLDPSWTVRGRAAAGPAR